MAKYWGVWANESTALGLVSAKQIVVIPPIYRPQKKKKKQRSRKLTKEKQEQVTFSNETDYEENCPEIVSWVHDAEQTTTVSDYSDWPITRL